MLNEKKKKSEITSQDHNVKSKVYSLQNFCSHKQLYFDCLTLMLPLLRSSRNDNKNIFLILLFLLIYHISFLYHITKGERKPLSANRKKKNIIKPNPNRLTSDLQQALVLVVTAVVFGTSIWGVTNLRQEFNPVWFIPQSSYLFQFLSRAQTFYPEAGEALRQIWLERKSINLS